MKDLASLRAEIDQLDEQLWAIIGKRADVARQIGEWKLEHDEPIVQAQRYQQVLERCQQLGQQYGLSETVIREVMEALHKEALAPSLAVVEILPAALGENLGDYAALSLAGIRSDRG